MPYLAKKLLQMFITILLLVTIVFFIARLAPGDPLAAYYGAGIERLSESDRSVAMENLGLAKPLLQQYKSWLQDVAHGDWGISYKYKQDTVTIIKLFAKNTIWLSLPAYALTFLLAILLAFICVYQQGKWLDTFVCKIGIVTASIPPVWIALILILLFSVNLSWLPASGAYASGEPNNLLSRIEHLILPVTVLVLSHLWYYAYMIRNKLLSETRENYILLCRAKGLGKRTILWHHCLKNVSPTIFTMIGLSIPHLISGTYVIEKVFSYPGLGSLVFESVRYHDYNLLMLLTVLTGSIVVIVSFTVDIINRLIDPRITSESGKSP